MLSTRLPIPSLLLSLLGACAVTPEHGYPMHEDHDFVADFVVDENGLLMVPTTTANLVIRNLQVAPDPREELFGDHGGRYFRFAPGTKVTVRGSMTIYSAYGVLPTLQQVLPGAVLREAETGETEQLP